MVKNVDVKELKAANVLEWGQALSSSISLFIKSLQL